MSSAFRPFVAAVCAGLAALVLPGCVVEEGQGPALVDPTEFVTYVHSSGVFTLDLPPNWVVNDTSTDVSLTVAFSPPDSPEPLVGVYVASLNSLTATTAIEETGEGLDLQPIFDTYIQDFYVDNQQVVKDLRLDNQPDGSTRLTFITETLAGPRQQNDFVQVIGPYLVVMRITVPDDIALNRTLSRVINTLYVNPAASWASASQASDDEQSADAVIFSNLNAWVDRNNGFTIAGQVQNNAPGPLEFVRITAQLFDDQNRVLFEQDDFVSSDLIKPGEYAPFSIVFSDGLPAGTVRYDINASARYADFTIQTFYGPENFALTSEANFDENGLLVISGVVRNEGSQVASLVKVIVTVFDSEQRVAGTDTTLVDQQRLAPGEVSDYSVVFVELGGTPNTFLVTAQAIVE